MKLYFCMVAERLGSDLGEIEWEQVDTEAASSTARAASADSARWLGKVVEIGEFHLWDQETPASLCDSRSTPAEVSKKFAYCYFSCSS